MLEELCTLYEETLIPGKIERIESDNPSVPCPYHFTPDEIMEYIELGCRTEPADDNKKKFWTAQ